MNFKSYSLNRPSNRQTDRPTHRDTHTHTHNFSHTDSNETITNVATWKVIKKYSIKQIPSNLC